MSINIALRAAFLFWPSTGSFVLTVAVVAVAVFFIVRYVKNKDSSAAKVEEAYPQTSSVRTNVQSAKTTPAAKSDDDKTTPA